MAKVTFVRIPETLLEEARKALELGEDTMAVAIVRKALIQAIGDDTMPYTRKLGRPFKSDKQ